VAQSLGGYLPDGGSAYPQPRRCAPVVPVRGPRRITKPVRCSGLDDPQLPKQAVAKLCEVVEIAKGLCPPFDIKCYRSGHLTPVYFGSALNNFGVRDYGRQNGLPA